MADTATILARFPGPVLLRPSRLKWSAVTAGALLFMVVFLLGLGAWSPAGEFSPWIMIIGVVFSGGVAVVSIGHVLPGAGGLLLDRDVFEERLPFGRRYHAWSRVSQFEFISLEFIDYLRSRFRWPFRGVAFDDMALMAGKPATRQRVNSRGNSALFESIQLDTRPAGQRMLAGH